MIEPVAWMHTTICSWVSTFIHPETEPEEWIPLYTHPSKDLTDEEIREVYGEYFDVENCDWLHLQCIQAILKKANK